MADTEKVVSLRGEKFEPRGEPIESVVKAAEEILAMAKVGEVDGLVAIMHHSDSATSAKTYGLALSPAVIGQMEIVKHGLSKLFLETSA